jgi:hypothetical protein
MAFSDKLIARGRRIARKSGLGHLVEPEIHKFPPRDFVVDNPMAEFMLRMMVGLPPNGITTMASTTAICPICAVSRSVS